MTFAFFTDLVIFLGNMPSLSHPWVSPSVDVGPESAPFVAALIDLGLVALFGLQHSAMARPGFKAWWTRIVPKGLERSTYVMAASLVGFVMVGFWSPFRLSSGTFLDLARASCGCCSRPAGRCCSLRASASTYSSCSASGRLTPGISGRPTPPLTLKTNWLYDWMKHPMYAGVLLGLWMTPHLTVGHALMAGGFTLYILIAMRFEERDLSRNFGDAYQAWRSRLPTRSASARRGRESNAVIASSTLVSPARMARTASQMGSSNSQLPPAPDGGGSGMRALADRFAGTQDVRECAPLAERLAQRHIARLIAGQVRIKSPRPDRPVRVSGPRPSQCRTASARRNRASSRPACALLPSSRPVTMPQAMATTFLTAPPSCAPSMSLVQ